MGLRGLALSFLEGGATLGVVTEVSGKKAMAQNAAVNVVTAKGSDKVFPDRGTDLLARITRAGLPNPETMLHVCNFAASDVLFFCRSVDFATDADSLALVKLVPLSATNQTLVYGIGLEFLDRAVLQVPTYIPRPQ